MKKVFVGILFAASLAQAQAPAPTTTATATATPAPAATAAATAPAAQTSISDMKPLAPSRFGGMLAMENWAGVKNFQSDSLGRKAPVMTAWTASLKYKTTDKTSVDLQQIAYSRSNLEDGGDAAVMQGKQFNMNDLVLRGNLKSDLKLLNSNPIGFNLRYYFPTSGAAREVAKRNGLVRLDGTPAWDLTTKLSFSFYNSVRVTLNSPQSSVGSDAVYRLVTGPSLEYSFTDKVSAYVSQLADLRSREIGRGTWAPERGNASSLDIGANFTIGKVTINPSISSDTDFNDGSASVLTTDSRVYSSETSSYNLNIYATF